MSVSVISRVRELAQLGDLIEAKQAELFEMRNQFTQLSQEVHTLASGASNGVAIVAPTPATVKQGSTGRRGRPPGSRNKTKATTAKSETTKNRRGRPPGSRNKTKATAKVAASERNYNNDMSLRAVVWGVLDRKPADWRKILGEDLPPNVTGLKVSDIKNIVEAEKQWTSSSENISPQVQQAVYTLKSDGKVIRGDDKRYSIVKGAKIDG